MRKARIWAVVTAVTPIALPLLAIGVVALGGAIVGFDSGGLAWYWVFVLMFGVVVFVPGIVVMLVGAARLGRRGGTTTTVIGAVLLAVAAVLMILAAFEDAHLGAENPGLPRMVAVLSTPETVAFSAPYLLVVLSVVCACWHVVVAGRARSEPTPESA
ncbi:hypothetical protein [Nocardia mangyaensis]|uniref:hypothetical protein n=1 Tax=Nocardia mangyaensis TaxID=2213200 RepID=UPI002676D823|nr:hypothetical protein [Nocardia mangyaensis]MDO3645372.1 hypothetical protein [Nocardia mangyaensis]